PSGVDMAKLKYAFQAEYYKTHRRQLRDYVFGYFHTVAGLAASIAPVSNALMNISVIKNLVAQILGITTQRPFPKFKNHVTLLKGHRDDVSAAKSLSSQEEILRQQAAQNDRRKVVFLSDAFSRYIEPEVEQAALDILSKCGYSVHVLPVIGTGASFLSKGFVDEAQRHATRLLDLLNQADPAREAPIVGIEPPEIYTLKHDYLDLLPQRAEEIHQRI